MKLVIKIILLLFVIACLVVVIFMPEGPDSSARTDTPENHNGIAVIFFHGYARCEACTSIESLTRETLQSHFQSELDSDTIQFFKINLDVSANAHYVTDFNLSTRPVVLAKYSDGNLVTWQVLDDVWYLYKDPQAFTAFMSEQIKQFIDGEQS